MSEKKTFAQVVQGSAQRVAVALPYLVVFAVTKALGVPFAEIAFGMALMGILDVVLLLEKIEKHLNPSPGLRTIHVNVTNGNP